MYRSRDKIVRLAAAAGVSTAEIARRTDLARSTIYVILKTQEKPR
jgi:transposase-like protein